MNILIILTIVLFLLCWFVLYMEFRNINTKLDDIIKKIEEMK